MFEIMMTLCSDVHYNGNKFEKIGIKKEIDDFVNCIRF